MLSEDASSGTIDELAQPGQFGAYYLQELINRGGMAEIWLATDQNGKAYAVRRLLNGSLFNLLPKSDFSGLRNSFKNPRS